MLLQPRYVGRFRDVASVLIRHGFSDVLVALDLQRFLPGHTADPSSPTSRTQHRARALRLALEELGATYVKLGQLLSTRSDIFALPYLEELATLQDRVEPFPFADVRATLERELGGAIGGFFAHFDETSAAAASLAQVHRADLAPGTAPEAATREVAVKVLRPDIESQVELDLDLLGELARFIARSEIGRTTDAVGLAAQLKLTLIDELDLTREARNARHFRAAVAAYPRLRVPEPVLALTTRRVYTSEYVRGTRIADLGDLHLVDAASELWRAYLEQILVGGLFQCDPHPGNFLIDAEKRIVLLDHGMVAYMSRQSQLHLMSLLLALADGDGERVAEVCTELGSPGDDFREHDFKAKVGLLVARHRGLVLEELLVGSLVLEVARIAGRSDIRIPSELLLLGKTLLHLEGVCRRLDPRMDPVAIMRETAGGLLRQQLGREISEPRALGATLEARSLLAEVPTSVRRILRRTAANELRLGLRVEKADEIVAALHAIASRMTLGILTAGLIIGSALLLNVRAGIMVAGYPLFALLGFLVAAGLGIYLVVRIILFDRGKRPR